ncbi:hypothetical protein PIB30_062611 [Stylosanthes scabra]|uniref:Uncharacterized protein n=1 Tax=Stylosanthes scabra TaxID=79078 RepID=A0ABU6YME3_9FABA|nr:hypothetical protein [Stylosanthes scabra]
MGAKSQGAGMLPTFDGSTPRPPLFYLSFNTARRNQLDKVKTKSGRDPTQSKARRIPKSTITMFRKIQGTSISRIHHLSIHDVLEKADLISVKIGKEDCQLSFKSTLGGSNSPFSILGQILTLLVKIRHECLSKVGSDFFLGGQALELLHLGQESLLPTSEAINLRALLSLRFLQLGFQGLQIFLHL